MIRVQPLHVIAFAPFGTIFEPPAESPDSGSADWQWWAETAQVPPGDRPYSVGYFARVPGVASFDWAERHMRTVEVLIPLVGECVLCVAPPEDPEAPSRQPYADEFRAFRLTPGTGVILKPGIWHTAPLALADPVHVVVLLRQGTGSEDTQVARFPEHAVHVTTM